MGQQCPVCGRFNHAKAHECGCGWDFAAQRFKGLTLADLGDRSLKLGKRLILAGVAASIVIFATFAILKISLSGLVLFPLYGAIAHIAGGILLMIRGSRQRAKSG